MEGQFLAYQGFVTYSGTLILCHGVSGVNVWNDWSEVNE